MTVKVSVIGAGWFARPEPYPGAGPACRRGARRRLPARRGRARTRPQPFRLRLWQRGLSGHSGAPARRGRRLHAASSPLRAGLRGARRGSACADREADDARSRAGVGSRRSRPQAAGRHLVVANGYHYLDHLDPVRNALREGAVGSIEHVLCTFVSATRAVFEGGVGLKRWATTFFRPTAPPGRPQTRAAAFAYGQLSHSVAMMLHLTGLEPDAVIGRTLSRNRVDLCDAGVVRFATEPSASLSGAAAMPEGERGMLRFVITGADGVLEIEFDRDRAVLRRHDGANKTWEVPSGRMGLHLRGPAERTRRPRPRTRRKPVTGRDRRSHRRNHCGAPRIRRPART